MKYSPRERQLECNDTAIRQLPNGRFKAIGIGVPSYHFEDWRGCNSHFLTIPGQPHQGFASIPKLLTWLFSTYPNEPQAIAAVNAAKRGGRWTGGAGFISINWDKKSANRSSGDWPPKREEWLAGEGA